jgi:hypothetical protein
MRTFAAVTTMNKAYYDLIGHKMVQSFIKYWPKSVTLYVMTEGFDIPDRADNLVSMDIYETCNPQLQNFLDWRGTHFTRKFTYKAYAWINACKMLTQDVLIYLDADSETHAPVPTTFLENILPRNSIISYMYAPATRSTGEPVDNAETCIYFFNNQHPFAKTFMERYEHIYESREISDSYRFCKPHDTWVIADCVKLAESNHVRVTNLAPQKKHLSPIGKTVLSQYFSHAKGKRKYKENESTQ